MRQNVSSSQIGELVHRTRMVQRFPTDRNNTVPRNHSRLERFNAYVDINMPAGTNLHRTKQKTRKISSFQISYNHVISFETIPDDIVPLTAHFKQLLTLATKEQPLLLFLDSVDQLTGTQDANKVSWLPTRLPPYCKVRTNSFYVTFNHCGNEIFSIDTSFVRL